MKSMLSSLKLSVLFITSCAAICCFGTPADAQTPQPAAPAADTAPDAASSGSTDKASGTTSGSSTSADSSTVSGGSGSSDSDVLRALRDKKFAPNTEITDPRLRAQAGSLSRYSLQATLGYQGSTLNDISNTNQPNPDHLVGPHKTNIRGDMGGRIRLDSNRAFSLGTGVSALTPFNGLQRFDVNDPFVGFDVTKKVGGIQGRASVRGSLVTTPEYRDVGEVAGARASVGGVYVINESRWAVNLDAAFGYNAYNRAYIASSGTPPSAGTEGRRHARAAALPDSPDAPFVKGDGNAQQASLNIFPGLQYKITDNLNVATSLSFSYYNPRSSDNQVELRNATIGERVGLGWAFRRDIYIYPYITMYPTDMAINTTSFNFSTVFSLL